MKKYNSKIGLLIVFFITAVIAGTSVILVKNHAWIGLAINIAVVMFVAYIFQTTYYLISGNDLIVRSGFFYNTTIDIHSIQRIAETHNPLASPAASLDRLAVYYGQNGFIILSPKDKIEFISHLRSVNPKIEIILRKK
jgi:hypothetical protein